MQHGLSAGARYRTCKSSTLRPCSGKGDTFVQRKLFHADIHRLSQLLEVALARCRPFASVAVAEQLMPYILRLAQVYVEGQGAQGACDGQRRADGCIAWLAGVGCILNLHHGALDPLVGRKAQGRCIQCDVVCRSAQQQGMDLVGVEALSLDRAAQAGIDGEVGPIANTGGAAIPDSVRKCRSDAWSS